MCTCACSFMWRGCAPIVGGLVSPILFGLRVGVLVGRLVSPALVGAGVPLVKHSGCAVMKPAPIGCALKYTVVVVAEHQRGTVARLTAEPHARLSAAPAARHVASEPM
jgi:hypothetical protein